jgi:uncharacterized membrane protein YoaK (UPF0700 family)
MRRNGPLRQMGQLGCGILSKRRLPRSQTKRQSLRVLTIEAVGNVGLVVGAVCGGLRKHLGKSALLTKR